MTKDREKIETMKKDLVTVRTGWFIPAAGNWYGPYVSREEAVDEYRRRNHKSPNSISHPVYGTAYTKNKSLIKFDNIIPAEEKTEPSPRKQTTNAMWKLRDLMAWQSQAEINGKWVPARPLNYRPEHCSLLRRLRYAFEVVRGRAETFTWPEDQ